MLREELSEMRNES
jgi:chromosome segregation ATPase